MKTFFTSVFLLLCVFQAVVNGTENTNHKMTSGTFGVAWIDSEELLHVFDGNRIIEPSPGTKTREIAAADLLEEGQDQLVWIDAADKSLFVYSFKTEQTHGPFGHNVSAISSGRFSSDEKYPSLFACTLTGNSYRWSKNVMEKGWIEQPGEFSFVSSGQMDRKNELNDFAVVTAGNVYVYSPKWQTYSKAVEGKNIASCLFGELTESPGDEIVMLDNESEVWLYQNKKAEKLDRKAVCLVFGSNGDGKLDTLYSLDPDGTMFAYESGKKTWTALDRKNSYGKNADASGASDRNLITRRNPDASGHSLYELSGGELRRLWTVENGKIAKNEELIRAPLSLDEKPLAYCHIGGVTFKPYLDTLRTPSGRNVLRDSPSDHIHHHGLMFAIFAGGCDFWAEFDPNFGRQVVDAVRLEKSKLDSTLIWTAPGDKPLLKEQRSIKLNSGNEATLLDWESEFTAPGDVKLGGGGGHYFGLGMRFERSMDTGGRFFNDTGKFDGDNVRGDERLTPCRWMAYTAKLHGEPVTVAEFAHPSNPIPMLAFTMGDAGTSFAFMGISLNLHKNEMLLKEGESLMFKYRIAVWDGEVSPETVEKAYADYIK